MHTCWPACFKWRPVEVHMFHIQLKTVIDYWNIQTYVYLRIFSLENIRYIWCSKLLSHSLIWPSNDKTTQSNYHTFLFMCPIYMTLPWTHPMVEREDLQRSGHADLRPLGLCIMTHYHYSRIQEPHAFPHNQHIQGHFVMQPNLYYTSDNTDVDLGQTTVDSLDTGVFTLWSTKG